jgi:hypothetical protein
MIAAFLLRHGLKLVAGAAVAALFLWIPHSLKEAGRNEIRPELDRVSRERDNLLAVLEIERANAKKAEDAVNAYSREIAGLRRVLRDRPPVRVCFSDAPDVPAAGPATEGAAGATPAAGSLPGAPRGDLAALRDLAYQCDTVSARLRALQRWASPSDQTVSPKSSN